MREQSWGRVAGSQAAAKPPPPAPPLPLPAQEMGSRHRVRASSLQIIKTATLKASQCKRPAIMQFHDSKIKFPLTRRMARPSDPTKKTLFKASRPNVSIF